MELHVFCWLTLTDRMWLVSIEQLGVQGTTVLVGAAEASWTRGLVERHGAYVRSMVEKMVHDGVSDDMSAQSLLNKATSIRHNGCLPRNRESLSLS